MAIQPRKRQSLLEQFFAPVGQDVAANPNQRMKGNFVAVKGSLVSFNYTFWKHDPYPLIIIIDNNPASDKLSGINLHRLTFPSIRELIAITSKMGFSYKSVSDDENFKAAYRSYKRIGVRQMKVLDSNFLLRIMSAVRSYDPAEVQIIRRQVQEQIRQQTNPKASQMTTLNQPQQGQINSGE